MSEIDRVILKQAAAAFAVDDELTVPPVPVWYEFLVAPEDNLFTFDASGAT